MPSRDSLNDKNKEAFGATCFLARFSLRCSCPRCFFMDEILFCNVWEPTWCAIVIKSDSDFCLRGRNQDGLSMTPSANALTCPIPLACYVRHFEGAFKPLIWSVECDENEMASSRWTSVRNLLWRLLLMTRRKYPANEVCKTEEKSMLDKSTWLRAKSVSKVAVQCSSHLKLLAPVQFVATFRWIFAIFLRFFKIRYNIVSSHGLILVLSFGCESVKFQSDVR